MVVTDLKNSLNPYPKVIEKKKKSEEKRTDKTEKW